jgi:hypothetical protein
MAAIQDILKDLGGQRTEQENLQIVQQVRALRLSRDELYAFINGGALPASLAGAVTGDNPPETIYTRRGRPRRDTGTPEEEPGRQIDDESEDLDHEEQ